MPRREAAATSMVLYPAPARTTSESRPALSIASVTLVLRTTRTSACVSAIARVSASSLSSGCWTTSQPAAWSPSIPLFSKLSAISTFMMWLPPPLDQMHDEAVAELGLEPGRLGRHDAAGVRDRQQVVHGHRVERERDRRAAAVDRLLERRRAARAADEVDARIGAHVSDIQQVRKYGPLQDRHVELVDPVGAFLARRVQLERVPVAVEVHR